MQEDQNRLSIARLGLRNHRQLDPIAEKGLVMRRDGGPGIPYNVPSNSWCKAWCHRGQQIHPRQWPYSSHPVQ
jgi:hypothetical protein